MSRTTMDISISGYTDELDSRIRQVLIGAHYKEIEYYREMVWKKGTGMMTAMHYIKVEYPDYQTVRLSGWVQIGVGSVGGKERDLSGLTGIIPKKSVQGTMKAIEAAILQFDRENPIPYVYADPTAETINTENNAVYDAPYVDAEPQDFPPEQPVPAVEETAVYDAPYVDAEPQDFPPEQPVPAIEETVEAPDEQPAPPAPQQEEPAAEPIAEEPLAEQNASAQPEPVQSAEANPFQRAVRPCSDNFTGDRKYLLWLCGASFAGELPQGQSEYFAVDTRTNQPYYIISYRSSLPTQNRYEVKEPVSWEELDRYCSVNCRECLGITGTFWKDAVCSVQKDATHITVLWRKNDQCLEEASIFRKNDSFTFAHSEKGGLHDPTAKGTRSALTPRQYRSETTFRIAVQSKISKEYVVQLLWEFLKENLQAQPITETSQEPSVEERRYQADQVYAQQNLNTEEPAAVQNPAEPEPPAPPAPAATEPAPQREPEQPAPAEPTPPPAVPEERPLPAPTNQPPKKIIFCPNCGCKLKVPDKNVKLHVICPKCKFDFYHKD